MLEFKKNEEIDLASKPGAAWRLGRATFLEETGNYEEAAGVYESIARDHADKSLFPKIKELREKARNSQLKIIYINANEVISQLKKSPTEYRCDNCSAPIGEKDKECDHCGYTIPNKLDPSEILRAIH
ncbi:MAG: hypothetical protein V1678_04945 [Candidatus Aenigmatarchaeota archaeon]